MRKETPPKKAEERKYHQTFCVVRLIDDLGSTAAVCQRGHCTPPHIPRPRTTTTTTTTTTPKPTQHKAQAHLESSLCNGATAGRAMRRRQQRVLDAAQGTSYAVVLAARVLAPVTHSTTIASVTHKVPSMPDTAISPHHLVLQATRE